ncbi:hypothetical protein [Algoriphagus aquimarinus]|uniref:Helix-turn-helix domain-containing protein n=1 Tax=Algoriphagus aquimarinus TaxID=237018 RepID=A0A1I1BIF3_9BACT|nr:hypothetical protein [Algoriphagus aquimarinus]SFB49927.1 hypothetical protein SAMN04489723_11419 [Algoriphagus aquimarinus]
MTALGMEYYVERIVKERGIQPTRVSVFLAMLQLWKEQKRCNPFQISRRKIMKLSGVKSIVTYHKCISELTDRGLVEYRPSYHPWMGSEVRLK